MKKGEPNRVPLGSTGLLNAVFLALDAFVTALRAHGQLLASLAATCAQNIAAVGRRHALAEAVLVAALPN